jgi:hypothetical protein
MSRTGFCPEQSLLVCQVIIKCCSETTHLDPLYSSDLSPVPWVYTDWVVDNAVQASCGAILNMGSTADSIGSDKTLGGNIH